MTLSFLFWNTMRRDLRPLICRAVVEYEVDVLLLAEVGATDAEMLDSLLKVTTQNFVSLASEADKVRIFTRLPEALWTRRQTDALSARMSIWSIEIGQPPGVLLAVAHFVSRLHSSTDDQSLLATELAKEIDRVEQFVGHERTLIVGDLNMNPFEAGMIGAPALHGVMTKRLAESRDRTVLGKKYRFFYNPMWGQFGDRTDGPPGTYFYRSGHASELFWHTFDQVLLRPDLMNSVVSLKVLDRIENEALLATKSGQPISGEYSDHLPVTFTLMLE